MTLLPSINLAEKDSPYRSETHSSEDGVSTVLYNEHGEEIMVLSETDTHRILVWKK